MDLAFGICVLKAYRAMRGLTLSALFIFHFLKKNGETAPNPLTRGRICILLTIKDHEHTAPEVTFSPLLRRLNIVHPRSLLTVFFFLSLRSARNVSEVYDPEGFRINLAQKESGCHVWYKSRCFCLPPPPPQKSKPIVDFMGKYSSSLLLYLSDIWPWIIKPCCIQK